MLYLSILHFIKRVMNKLRFPSFIKNVISDMSYNYVEKKILPDLKLAYKSVKNDNKMHGNNSGIIWIFWWQGYENMPPIVNRCIESVKYNAGNHKVVLVTKDNIYDYTNISSHILDKLANGNITLTHFSDILRFNLLSNYGGLWMDATVYCTSKITDNYFDNLYTSGGYKGIDPKFVDGKWTGFLIGGSSSNELFRFMNCFFDIYWKRNDKLIQYFLIDYGLDYSYRNNIGGFKDYADNVACHNNHNLFNLSDLLNDKFNNEKYDALVSDTKMFKLTYKMKFTKLEETFYNKIISDDRLFMKK